MAEILGTIASGFAVISLAIQIAGTIQKLKNFHSLMQSAPTDILFAIEELETLSMVLEDVDRSMQEQSWRMCQVATDGMVELVNKLEEHIGKGKMRAKFKFAKRKGQIDEFRTRIECAKTTMLLANQVYYQATQRQRWETLDRDVLHLQRSHERNHNIIEREVTQIRAFVINAPQSSVPSSQKLLADVGTAEVDADNGNETDVELRISKRTSSSGSRQHRPRFNDQNGRILLSGLLAINLARGEKFTTTSILFGDVAGLQRLFSDGQATPLELDPDGRTPLHYAALYAQPAICNLLLEHGADVNRQTFWIGRFCQTILERKISIRVYSFSADIPSEEIFRRWAAHSTPSHFLLSTGRLLTVNMRPVFRNLKCPPVSTTSMYEDYRLTLEALMRSGADAMLKDQYSRTAYSIYTGPASLLHWLIKDDEWNFKNISPQDLQFMIIFQVMHGLKFEENLIEPLLQIGTEDILKVITQPLKYEFTVLYLLVSLWVCCSWQGSDSTHPAMERLLLNLIRAGVDVHSLSSGGYTPLLVMLGEMGRRTGKFLIRKWLELLSRGGVDLVEYSRIENELHDNNGTDWELKLWCDLDYYVSLLQLRIGETPDDFYIEFEHPYVAKGWAVHFWLGVDDAIEEERTRSMPGRWHEDETE
ncbi:uncharacterized protein RSE6_13187 [Rhynchosporium secalis]|uniref:Uncharacterized protein n=1 Tax=Rhynchosporium secalis TaxID=38038 RepID=A0A1E1MSC5_RHYSE|nr:uncharacterized protein RSE6_13187 [Rhynchosporium secalis]